jgi:hypothetical protein
MLSLSEGGMKPLSGSWRPPAETPKGDEPLPGIAGSPGGLRSFAGITEHAGLAGVTLHTLRHSTASTLIASGAHIKVVQDLLGHSSYAITADIYSRVNIEHYGCPIAAT